MKSPNISHRPLLKGLIGAEGETGAADGATNNANEEGNGGNNPRRVCTTGILIYRYKGYYNTRTAR